jgi:hypothetical protein
MPGPDIRTRFNMDPCKEKEIVPKKRSEPRKVLTDYYSVEFAVSRELPIHQFRVRDMSPWGLGILVNETSAALKHLNEGDVLEMKYNPVNASGSAEHLKTRIEHITRLDQGPFKGHYLVGLLILERNNG